MSTSFERKLRSFVILRPNQLMTVKDPTEVSPRTTDENVFTFFDTETYAVDV